MRHLAGKTALITGSAGGIGLGIARACARAELRIVLSDIDEPALERASAELRDAGAEVSTLPLDVRDRGAWSAAVEQISATLGPVQLLVNNAGISTLGVAIADVTPDLWDLAIGINLTGVYNGVHAFLPGMIAVGGGHIVNISSIGGLMTLAGLAPYSAAKFGVVGMSEVLHAELAELNIGCSVVCPGGVQSRLRQTSRTVRGLPAIEPPVEPSDRAGPPLMDADEVGRRVIDRVLAGELYIITHPEFRGAVESRHLRIMAGFDRA